MLTFDAVPQIVEAGRKEVVAGVRLVVRRSVRIVGGKAAAWP